MKSAHFGMLAIAASLIGLSMSSLASGAMQSNPGAPAAASQPAQSQPAAAKKLDPQALERGLSEMLQNVVLEGTWQMVRAGGDGKLSPPKPDKYTIESANKAEKDWWVIRARIQFEQHDVTLPVRVRVVWAEDTPIVTVDETAFPGIGTYSARVMFYRGYYSGTWFGAGYGGIMSGTITKAPAETATPSDK